MKWAVVLLGVLLGACAYEPIHLVDAGDVYGSDGATEGGLSDRDVNEAGLADHEMVDAGDRDADAGDRDADDAGPDAAGSMPDASPDADGSLIDADDPDALRVEPLFAAAPRWNDHVADDNPFDDVTAALLDRSAEACLATRLPTSALSCFHGGGLRKLELLDQTQCDGLVLTDARAWLYWNCVERAGHVVFEAFGMLPDIGLRDLLDLTDPLRPRWQTNQLTVRRGTDVVAQTRSHAFWSNPVLPIAGDPPVGAHSLDVDGAIYVVTEVLNAPLHVLADHVTLTGVATVPIQSDGYNSEPLLVADGRAFFWFEDAYLDPDGRTTGIDLDVTFSTLRHITIDRTGPGPGMDVDARIRAFASTLDNVKSLNAAADGIEISGAANVVHILRAYDAAARGLVLLADNTMFDVVVATASGSTGIYASFDGSFMAHVEVARAGGDGVRLEASRYCRLTDVTATSNAQAGVIVTGPSADPDDTELNFLHDVMATNNGDAGIQVRGRNQIVGLVVSASNGTAGIDLAGSAHVLQHVTVANNGEAGMQITGVASGVHVINAVAVNNTYGLRVRPGASDTRVHDLVAVSNGTDVLSEGERDVFSGALILTGSAPPQDLSQAFVGIVSEGDMSNADYGRLAQPQGSVESDQITDWLMFSARQRHWGKYAVATFPNAILAGDCRASGVRCVVWDWRIASAGVLRDVYGSTLMISALNASVHQRQHTWDANDSVVCQRIRGAQWDGTRCTSTFLAYAFEGENGNNNGLCETIEGCFLNRHRGGYPGEGALEPVNLGGGIPGFGELYLRRYVTAGP